MGALLPGKVSYTSTADANMAVKQLSGWHLATIEHSYLSLGNEKLGSNSVRDPLSRERLT